MATDRDMASTLPTHAQRQKVREGSLFAPPLWRYGQKLGDLEEPSEPWAARWVELAWLHQTNSGTWLIEPGPRQFPQLIVSRQEKPAYGRPRLAEGDRYRCELVVRLIDICGESQGAAARRLCSSMVFYPEREGVLDPERAALDRVRRAYRAGRRDLRARGVLPWAAFTKGIVPADWWTNPDFAWAIDLWRRQAVTWPADHASTTFERVMARTANARRAALAEIERTPWQPNPRGPIGAPSSNRRFYFSKTVEEEPTAIG